MLCRPSGRPYLHRFLLLAVRGSLVLPIAALAACSASRSAPPPPPEPVGLVGRIYDVASGSYLTEQELAARLVGPRYVLLGERHDNPEHHLLQARMIELLLASGVRPVVVFEMLTTERSGAIRDCESPPRCSPEEFRNAVEWDASGWPEWPMYEPVFAAAIDAGLTIVAGDVPQRAIRVIASSSGNHADVRAQWIEALRLDRPLGESQTEDLAAEIRDSHCGYLPSEAVPAMVRAQRARDAHLAMATERAAADRGAVAVLIAGLGHTRTDRGVPHYFTDPQARQLTLSIALLEADPSDTDPMAHADRRDATLPYDIVWFTPQMNRPDPCEQYRDSLEAMRK